jgi:hypothetical protein
MKYRDPTIRVCRGPVAPIKVITAKVPSAPITRTHRLPGVTPFEARELPTIDRFDRLPGGLPPEPNRTPWRRAGETGKGAREPFNSRAVKGEHYATRDYLD